jgi:tRNA-binding EMAP/Myf-like protein
MYRLFYDQKSMGDVLFILLNPEEKVEKVVKKDAVAALYHGDALVGINIFDFSKVVKLKANGILFAPKKELLDVINAILANASLAPLPLNENSGYQVAEITALEEHPLDEKAHIVTLSMGEKSLTTVSWYPTLSVGKKVVVALDGTILRDGSVFHSFISRNIPNQCSICSAKELGLPGPEGAFFVEEEKAGEDFFYGGK